MSDREQDPSANTAKFQAFVQEDQQQGRNSRGESKPPIAGIAVAVLAAVIVIGVIAWALL